MRLHAGDTLGVTCRGMMLFSAGPEQSIGCSADKAEVRRSFITTTVREQHPGSHHKGATGRVRTGDQRYSVSFIIANLLGQDTCLCDLFLGSRG